ncbi:hypothetical protein H4Q26_015332 [Puccinia striiformis f. sp. tritici PST-130]|nr:hypothetical protein H4Q26_015332 [Puccinia striiformis f. sp. tritici PST-130]
MNSASLGYWMKEEPAPRSDKVTVPEPLKSRPVRFDFLVSRSELPSRRSLDIHPLKSPIDPIDSDAHRRYQIDQPA